MVEDGGRTDKKVIDSWDVELDPAIERLERKWHFVRSLSSKEQQATSLEISLSFISFAYLRPI